MRRDFGNHAPRPRAVRVVLTLDRQSDWENHHTMAWAGRVSADVPGCRGEAETIVGFARATFARHAQLHSDGGMQVRCHLVWPGVPVVPSRKHHVVCFEKAKLDLIKLCHTCNVSCIVAATIPMACYPCLPCSKHHAECMEKVGLI